MALDTFYSAGTVSVANGSTTVTGTGTAWGGDAIMRGDLFMVPSQPLVPPVMIDSVGANGELTLMWPWPGEPVEDAGYIIRYVGIIERSTAQSRKVLEELQAINPSFDVQVDTLSDRNAYDVGPPVRVLVSDIGDGTAAVYSKGNGDASWSAPARFSGPTLTLDVTEVDEVPYGTAPDVTLTPRAGGYDMSFDVPRGMIIEPGTVTTLPPDQQVAVNFEPITGGYRLDIAIPKGPTGDIDGVTPFWVSRLGSDVDAAAARAGLELVKQTSETDTTVGRLLTFGAFGLGKTVSLVSPDLAQVRPSGLYYCNSPSNGPGGNGWLIVRDLTSDYAEQCFISITGEYFTNLRSAGVWQGWTRLRPDYGSNANGSYLRFPDGTQICWLANISIAWAVTTPFNGGFLSAPDIRAFPAAFSAVPTVLQKPGGTGLLNVLTTETATQVSLYGLSLISQTGTFNNIGYTAIGRWK